MPVPVVWSADCLRHEPAGEVWVGVREPGTELPDRALVLRAALEAAGATVLDASPHDDTILRTVHDPRLVDHLAGIWADWDQAGLPADYGRDRVVPYLFPTGATLVGPGSWAAIRGSVDAALTAAGLVSSGARLAYALCRPPGHHATRGGYGGSCYLNNAAVAAEALRVAGAAQVAVLDIDAHHGNGTQMIFYDRPDVWYGSLHVDPGAGWFPHYAGYPDERGRGGGEGYNWNLPLAPGTGDDGWLAALDVLCVEARELRPDAVVVSLGLDAAAADPESPLQVTEAGYREAGRRIAAVAPAVFIQEGGYDLASLGALAVATLEGAVA